MNRAAIPSLKELFRSNRTLLVCLALAAATLLVYGRTGRFDYTNYDDNSAISRNPYICGGVTLPGILWALRSNFFDYWHPVTWWSHMLDYELFGPRPGLHHLVNVSLHIANALLLFGLWQRMTGAWKRSALVAALFALHPMHVESVAWLIERKDVLSAFFGLLTLTMYVRYTELSGVQTPKAKVAYRLGLLFFALSLMSKAMLVTLPFVLLLLDYWPLGRMPGFQFRGSAPGSPAAQTGPESVPASAPGPGAEAPATGRSVFWGLVREKLPFFALAFASSVVTFSCMRSFQNVMTAGQVTWGFRLANTPVSYARYLGKLIWPSSMGVYYPSPDHWPLLAVTAAILLLLLISLAAIEFARPAPYLIFGWLLFLGMLVPVIGIVSMSRQAMADRYTYLPSVGIFVAGVWALGDLWRRRRWPPTLSWAAATAVLGVYGWIAWVQTGYWRNGVTLWTHCVAVTRENAVAHFGLGCALMDYNRPDEALVQLREAVRLEPDYAEANMNLGLVYLLRGDVYEATNYFGKTLQLRPDSVKGQRNMGNALYQLKRFTEATNHYALALQGDAVDQPTWRYYARALIALGDFSGALARAREALRLDPNDLAAALFEGEALSGLGRSDEAFQRFFNVLAADPGNARARCDLGWEWLKRGSFDQALTEFGQVLQLPPAGEGVSDTLERARQGKARALLGRCRDAVRANPDAPTALNNLAWLLATSPTAELRDGAEAVRLAERACETTAFQQPLFIGTLAAAYAEAGRFDQAMQAAERASAVALSLGETNLYNRNQELLRQYQRGEAHRESE